MQIKKIVAINLEVKWHLNDNCRLQEEGQGAASRRGHRLRLSPAAGDAAGEDYVHAAEADGGRQVEEGDGQRRDAATRALWQEAGRRRNHAGKLIAQGCENSFLKGTKFSTSI